MKLKIAIKSKASSATAMAADRQIVAGSFLILSTDNERKIFY